MAREKWQRRHYETIAAGLKAKRASGANVDAEVDQWVGKFAADNPRFRSDFFRAAIYGGKVTVQGPRLRGGGSNILRREYRNRSRPKRPFKVPALSGYRRGGKCKFGKKRVHGRFVCRKSPRRK